MELTLSKAADWKKGLGNKTDYTQDTVLRTAMRITPEYMFIPLYGVNMGIYGPKMESFTTIVNG